MGSDLGIVLTARPSYAKFKPILNGLFSIGVTPDIYVCASALLPRYGEVVNQVEADFPNSEIIEVPSVVEGNDPVHSVLSTANLTDALGRTFHIRKPRMVVIMADRHETLGASIAASYQNIKIAHIQGGEQSGNIDDKVRNANTMLADYHFPATSFAASRLAFARTHHVYKYGCPSIDLAKAAEYTHPVTDQELGGEGVPLDLTRPFYAVLYHPETEYPDLAYVRMRTILRTLLRRTSVPLLVFWPGQDTGMDGVSKAVREFKVEYPDHIRTVRTLPPERFLRLMYQTTALVGNSSAGIRECSFIGTPVFNIGERQRNRERGLNVREGLPTNNLSLPKIPSHLYGDGTAGPRIAAKLQELVCQ